MVYVDIPTAGLCLCQSCLANVSIHPLVERNSFLIILIYASIAGRMMKNSSSGMLFAP